MHTRRPIKVALLGFWFSHAFELCHRALEADFVELVTTWDSDVTRGETAARDACVPFEPRLEAVIERDDLDAVMICTEPFSQPELVEAAAHAGKHALVEKPMAADIAGAKRILAAGEERGVQIMPAHNLQFHPVPQLMHRLVMDGAIGTPVRARRSHGHNDYEPASYDVAAISDGWAHPQNERRGALFHSGAHTALWYQWMFGTPRSVYCMTHTALEALPVEDHAHALLRYSDAFVGSMELSEILVSQQVVTEIYGTEGVLIQYGANMPASRVYAPNRPPLMLFRMDTNRWEAPILPTEFLRHELEHSSAGQFFLSVSDGLPVPLNHRDGYASIATLEAASVSATEGREVDLTEIAELKSAAHA